MNKKYQVFVSSTYQDLLEERQEVIHALLELDCIPSGMELFPAADEDQWSLIKGVIDECDYYILILAGRYGSTGSDGVSYTEKEYQYALETGKPIIAFLHSSPGSISSSKSEESAEGKKKLEVFRDLAQKKMCKFWDNPADLGGKVSRALVQLIKNHPGVGWVKGDSVLSSEATKEILDLKRHIEQLEKQLTMARTTPPAGSEDLSQGSDKFKFTCVRMNYGKVIDSYDIDIEWNKVFYILSPLMINEASETKLVKSLNKTATELLSHNYSTFGGEIICHRDTFHTIILQFRALGLICKSDNKHSIRDTSQYWKLTPFGDNLMSKLHAIRKDNNKKDGPNELLKKIKKNKT